MATAIRLCNPKGPDVVAVVSTEPVHGQPGQWLIKLGKGKTRRKMAGAAMFGPFPSDELDQQVARVVAQLHAEGFGPAGGAAMLLALKSTKPGERARAALRLGWRRDVAAVDAILAASAKAGEDVSSLVDALGAIGDARAIPLARAEAARKLLSRRRSGAEALRQLKDADGMTEVRKLALERLPVTLREALFKLDETDTAGMVTLGKVLAEVDLKDRGLAADTLYELGTPLCVGVAREGILAMPLNQAFVWRYAKSMFKRSMLRHDAVTFGALAHAMERAARTLKGTKATVKSGYDGKTQEMHIFSAKTQQHVQRLSWRYLRRLAVHRPELYAHAAAECVLHYSSEDGGTPRGFYGVHARSHLLMRVVFGGGHRFVLSRRGLRFRAVSAGATSPPPPSVREEAYPELWDAQPRAYLRLLARARLDAVQTFAERAVRQRHLQVLQNASHEDVASMLGSTYEPTVQLGLTELRRRFDVAKPDFVLIRILLADGRPLVRDLGLDWLSQTAHLWTRDAPWVVTLLTTGDALVRESVSRFTSLALERAEGAFKTALAGRMLAVLRAPEAAPGAHDALAQVASAALARELAPLLSAAQWAGLLTSGSEGARLVAAQTLTLVPGAAALLGVTRMVAMANDERATVRLAAHRLLRGAQAALQADPSQLFALLESGWKDTRSVAVEMLTRHVDLSALGLDGIMGLCDSMHVEAQDLGQEVVRRNLDTLDINDLIHRLGQHPHPNMRRFALELVVGHLKPGFVALARLDFFFRAILFDVWPERRLKKSVITFLGKRGAQDSLQAELATHILGDFVRTKGRADFELALQMLVNIKLAFPDTVSPVTLSAAVAP